MHDPAPVLSLRDVVAALEALYPLESAADWDRVGLVAGDLDQPVRRILFALDPTLAVIDEAREWGADLLVTHHPLLLRGVHSVATSSAKGASVTALVQGGVALWVGHTNADVADPGVSTVLADALGLTDQRPLSVEGSRAAGRVGELVAAVSLAEFADTVAAALPDTAGGIRVSGDPEGLVRTVAVMGGSGDDRFDDVRASGADVYVTADLRHHPVLEAREEARGGRPYLVDAGHWATESLWLTSGRDRLLSALGEAPGATRVETRVSTIRTEPWTFVVGANAERADRAAPEPGGVS
ncbi:Nif3-like dinuclear metal center hexameric protein [Terrabacter aerolatus]|uniref:GTP cyclohydrolase 1 type 2 homolog n=1 Tax=Terrabacter aerolatus TaxID=422442 RepID=A0A512D690_9MICO|nr:Nif3-like dinuclear metal center hexameric protein [Terrabacter aerolatus]GEO31993.1 GTP cyclohydrolase 1 type 2 [Terrabacter aerolatus]